MTALLDHVAPSVRRLSPYQPGRPIAEVAKSRGITDVVKLASNENPQGAGAAAVRALAAFGAQQFGRYPDANAGALRAALAAHLSLPEERFILGNGSNDILELAASLFLQDGAAAVYSQHAFIVYALATAARRARAKVVAAADFAHDLPAMAAAAQDDDARLVFVANPNNPTGTYHPPPAVRQFLRQVPTDVLVVLDEAYCEYLPEDENASLPLLEEFPNLLITRTFSKIHGLAGLRAGYGIGAPPLIDLLNRIRQPFNLNAAAQVAAQAALADSAHVGASRQMNADGMKTLVAEMRKRKLPFIPSFGNFLTFRPSNAAAAYETFLDGGVIVRKLAEYDLPDWLRVSIGKPAEMEKFLRLL